MSTTPTNEPTSAKRSAEDPWQVPAQRTARPAKAGVPQKGKTAAQKARLARVAQANARLAAQANWPTARGWTMAGAISRVLAGCALIVFGLEFAHLHALFTSPTTTADQWHSAQSQANAFSQLGWLVLASGLIPNQAWIRTRRYVAKLPGVAPHPMQRTNAIYQAQSVPAYWPPVPEGTASWTRRVHWRVPPAVNGAFWLVMLCNALADHLVLTGSGRYASDSALYIVAAVLAFTGAFFDLVRLRAYTRWPGRR